MEKENEIFENEELVERDYEKAGISGVDHNDETILYLSDDGVRVELDVEKDELEDIKKDARFDDHVTNIDAFGPEMTNNTSGIGLIYLINSECPSASINDIMCELADKYPDPKHDKREDVNEFLDNISSLIGYSYDGGNNDEREKSWSKLSELVTDKVTMGKPRAAEVSDSDQLADWKIYRMCLIIRTAMKLMTCRQYIDSLNDTTAYLTAMHRNFNNTLKTQIFELDATSKDPFFSLLFEKYPDPAMLASDCESFEKYNNICETNKHFIDEAKKEFDEYIKNNDPSKDNVKEKNKKDFEENEELSRQTKVYFDSLVSEKELTAINKKLFEEAKELKGTIDSCWNDALDKYKERINAVNEKITEYGAFIKSMNGSESEVTHITFIPRNTILGETEKDDLINNGRQYLRDLYGSNKEFYERLIMLDELKKKRELSIALEEKIFGSEEKRDILGLYFENGHEYSRIRKEDKFSFDDLMSDETTKDDREKCYDYFGSLMRISGDPNVKSHYDIDAKILYAEGEISSLLISGMNLETYKQYNLIRSLDQFNAWVSSVNAANIKYRYIEKEISDTQNSINKLDIESKRQISLIEKAAYEKSKENEYAEGIKQRKAAIKEAEDALIEAERNLKNYRNAAKLMASYNAIKSSLDDKFIPIPEKEEQKREYLVRNYGLMIHDVLNDIFNTKDIVKKKSENSSEYSKMIDSIGNVINAKTDTYDQLKSFTESIKTLSSSTNTYINAKKNQFWRRANSVLSQSRMNFAESILLISEIAEKEMERCMKVCIENQLACNALTYKKENLYSIILAEVNEKHKKKIN